VTGAIALIFLPKMPEAKASRWNMRRPRIRKIPIILYAPGYRCNRIAPVNYQEAPGDFFQKAIGLVPRRMRNTPTFFSFCLPRIHQQDQRSPRISNSFTASTRLKCNPAQFGFSESAAAIGAAETCSRRLGKSFRNTNR